MPGCKHAFVMVSKQFIDDPIPTEYNFYVCNKCDEEYETVDYA